MIGLLGQSPCATADEDIAPSAAYASAPIDGPIQFLNMRPLLGGMLRQKRGLTWVQSGRYRCICFTSSRWRMPHDRKSSWQRAQPLVIELDAKPGRSRSVEEPPFDWQLPAAQDLLVVLLPWVVRIARVGEVRDRRGDVRHRHQADAEMRVGMHRQAEAEHVAHPREDLRVAQAAPVVMIGQHDLHAVLRDAAAKLVEVGHDHIRGERQPGAPVELRHAVEPGRRVLVVLEHIAQALRPSASLVSSDQLPSDRCATGCFGKAALSASSVDDLVFRSEQRAGLELDAAEAVEIDHAFRLRHDLRFADPFAPRVRGIRRVDMLRVLEEKVCAERHFLAHRSAEQVDQRGIEVSRLDVQQGDLERRVRIRHLLRWMRSRRELGAAERGALHALRRALMRARNR